METKPETPTMAYEAKITEEVSVKLHVFGKIEKLTPSERQRVFKLGDAVNAAGNNGAPKERKTRTRKPAASAGTTELPAAGGV